MNKKISLIIPAYNEVETIGQVIKTAKKSDIFNEIVVVSDGSTDGTVQKALNYNVKTIALPSNIGKGAAMSVGIDNTTSEIIVFLDGDLVNLEVNHIKELVKPIVLDDFDMSCGVFIEGRDSTDFAQKITPWLTGQRALKRDVLDCCADLKSSKFGAELFLTKIAIEKSLKVKKVILKGLTHRTKEEKRGLIKGFISRMKMYWQVFDYFRRNNLNYNHINTVMK
ncbi:glycosyltransferase family 2 protein [Orenia marismortui]|uniref:Glucosyl-3-phosphoglycerate synthase n=1 Tax=Orenia marismortui TaxID=46469 RepID=A0A4R8H476_9FIRM|nr:glycosyltransferase family 2 protein [Orenia marismortui]TDX51560.1 glycosyltransferase involved in cell wall biosynthesis [Orenia marismortui]